MHPASPCPAVPIGERRAATITAPPSRIIAGRPDEQPDRPVAGPGVDDQPAQLPPVELAGSCPPAGSEGGTTTGAAARRTAGRPPPGEPPARSSTSSTRTRAPHPGRRAAPRRPRPASGATSCSTPSTSASSTVAPPVTTTSGRPVSTRRPSAQLTGVTDRGEPVRPDHQRPTAAVVPHGQIRRAHPDHAGPDLDLGAGERLQALQPRHRTPRTTTRTRRSSAGHADRARRARSRSGAGSRSPGDHHPQAGPAAPRPTRSRDNAVGVRHACVASSGEPTTVAPTACACTRANRFIVELRGPGTHTRAVASISANREYGANEHTQDSVVRTTSAGRSVVPEVRSTSGSPRRCAAANADPGSPAADRSTRRCSTLEGYPFRHVRRPRCAAAAGRPGAPRARSPRRAPPSPDHRARTPAPPPRPRAGSDCRTRRYPECPGCRGRRSRRARWPAIPGSSR